MTVSGELGEGAEPPRRILERGGEVVGLVQRALGVPLPATPAQQAVMFAGRLPALGRMVGPAMVSVRAVSMSRTIPWPVG